jgi:hypothetical protein
MRDERWRQRHEALEHEGVDRSAARIRGYLDDGLSAINSIGVATGEVSLNQIAEQKYTELQSKRQDLVKLWESLPDAYRDTVAVDAQRIVDSVFDQILSDGKESLDSGQRAQRSLGAAPNSPGTGRDTDDD